MTKATGREAEGPFGRVSARAEAPRLSMSSLVLLVPLVLLVSALSVRAQKYANDNPACTAHDRAAAAYEAGDFAAAAALFAEAAKLEPGAGQCQIQGRIYKPYTPHFYLAECHLKLGRCAEAKAAFRMARAGGVAETEGKRTLDGTPYRTRFPALEAQVEACRVAEPTGACCRPDGGCLEEQTEAQCSRVGGAWREGQSCRTARCPAPSPKTGACCLADGSCREDQTEGQCSSLRGTWQEGRSCSAARCPKPARTAACCLPDGTCRDGATAEECAALGGAWRLDESCRSGLCKQPETRGACCLDDGRCLGDLSAGECSSRGGTFKAEQACRSGLCPQPRATGACCRGDGTCRDGVERARCDGSWFEARSCGSVTCPKAEETGACCLADGTCFDGVTAGQCDQPGMSWRVGKTCRQAACKPAATGACCLGPGECETLAPAQCEARGGTFAADATCGGESGFCSEPQRVGACCLPDGSCADMSERMCAVLRGSFRADAWCTDRPCRQR